MSVGAGDGTGLKFSGSIVDGDTTTVLKSCQADDAPVYGVPDSILSGQGAAKETSSYGKSNFMLPVTFFDIQSNLTYLKECCPLTIKVVDCGKHPWYYNKYISSDLKCTIEGNETTNEVMNNVKSNDCINIDLTDKMYDKFEKVNYATKQSSSDKLKLKKSKERRKVSNRKPNIEKTRLQQDKLKKIALSKIDLSGIDFKRNKGLIGLKISCRTEVVENIPDDSNKVNVLSVVKSNEEPLKTETVSETTVNNNVDKYMSGVDKALCDVGTTIIPVNVYQSSLNEGSSESATKITTAKSAHIVQMSKNKLANANISKIVTKQGNMKVSGTEDPGAIASKQTSDGLFYKENKTTSVISTVEGNYVRKAPMPRIKKTRTESHKPMIKRVAQKDKKARNVKNKLVSKLQAASTAIQLKERSELRNKLMKELFRSPSPIFTCSKPNKPLFAISPKPDVQQELISVRNSDINKQPSLVNTETFMKEIKDPIHKSNIPLSQSEIAGPVTNEPKRDNNNPFTITPVSIDKLRYNDKTKSQEAKKDFANTIYEHYYKPPFQGEQSDKMSSVNNDVNKNILTITAVCNDISNKNCNTSNQAELPLITSTGSFHNSQNTSHQHCQDEMYQSVKAQVPAEVSPAKENGNQLIQQAVHRIPVQIQPSKRQKVRRDNPGNIPSLFSSPVGRLTSPQNPQAIHPSYNVNHFPRNSAPYSFFNPNYLQQNLSMNRNVPPQNMGNPNVYWPCLFPPQPPSLLIPPPPPPPPDKYETSLQNIAPKSHVPIEKSTDTVIKRINILARPRPGNFDALTDLNKKPSYPVHSNQFNLPEKDTKTNEEPKIRLSVNEVSDVKPVASKTEMFFELQKESLKINSELFKNETDNVKPNIPHEVTIPNTAVNSSQKVSDDHNKRIHQAPNSHSNIPSFASDSKILYNRWKEDQNNRSKKEDTVDWKIRRDEVDKPKNYSCDLTKRNNPVNDNRSETSKIRFNRPKAGPLCMKNRSGPYSKYQTPSPTRKPPPNKGYSPPILPIPTFQKTLEMLTQANDLQRQPNVNRSKCRNRLKHERHEISNGVSAEKRSKKRIEYFYMDNNEKSLKKITLQDYQDRVAKGEGKCIVLKKDRLCKRAKCNQSSEQDLGYDSDATVKL